MAEYDHDFSVAPLGKRPRVCPVDGELLFGKPQGWPKDDLDPIRYDAAGCNHVNHLEPAGRAFRFDPQALAKAPPPDGYTVLRPGQGAHFTVGQRIAVVDGGATHRLVIFEVLGDGRYSAVRDVPEPAPDEPSAEQEIRAATGAVIRVREYAVAVGQRVFNVVPDLHEVTTAVQELRRLANAVDDGPDMLPLLLACGEAEVAALRLVDRIRAIEAESEEVSGALYRLDQRLLQERRQESGRVDG